METKVMTNVLHALGGYDPEELDKEFFNEEVPENTIDDDWEDTDFLDLPHLPQRGRKSHSDDDAEKLEIRPGGNHAQNNMGVNSQNTTTDSEDTLRPSEFDMPSDQDDVDAVDQFLKSLNLDDEDDDISEFYEDDEEEDPLLFELSGLDKYGYFDDGPFKGNRTLELIDLLVRLALSYASKHGPVDQDEFKRLYYRIDFLKFSMFNEVTPDDLLGFKFLSGLISYEEYDQKLIELERLQDEAEI